MLPLRVAAADFRRQGREHKAAGSSAQRHTGAYHAVIAENSHFGFRKAHLCQSHCSGEHLFLPEEMQAGFHFPGTVVKMNFALMPERVGRVLQHAQAHYPAGRREKRPGQRQRRTAAHILDFNVLKIGRAAFAGIHLFGVPAVALQRTDVHRKILWHDGRVRIMPDAP